MIDLKKLKNKKILVTGGAGFIGSNLCDKLLELDSDVVCLDNFFTGDRSNLKNSILNDRFKLIDGDIRDFSTCLEATNGIDYVLHHAALGSVPRSIDDPLTSDQINIGGFVNILYASVKNNVQRFIYAASSSTYGDSKILPKVENKIGKPLSPYALTKYVNELYASLFNSTYGIDVIGLRYFNVYGRRQSVNGPYAAVIPKFIDKLIRLESPTINGDGSFSRDFTHVDNVIQMNLLAILTDDKKALNQIYNTAVGERTTILELFQLIRKFLSKYDKRISEIEVLFSNKIEGDVPHSLASIDKAKKLLKYNPEVKTIEGLQETVKWFIENKK